MDIYYYKDTTRYFENKDKEEVIDYVIGLLNCNQEFRDVVFDTFVSIKLEQADYSHCGSQMEGNEYER